MTIIADVRMIFEDARELQATAVKVLEQGGIRDAAEKAWGATKRATDALVLARTGDLPETTAITSRSLLALAGESADVESLVGRYYTRIGHLHGSCFYNGMCDPIPETERRIRETYQYIQDAETLAESRQT